MKLKLHHILVTTCLSILAPAGISTLHAQDASFDETPATSEKERVNYYPGGEGEPAGGGATVNTNSNKSTTALRDSSSFKTFTPARVPIEPSKHNAKPAHDEDDVLSFNFLYYIIRKYKLQDIVD
ncbi:hypothetical protein ACFQ21_24705 [Ohtaekwangia kribbensis]|jgi:hypothetical protein|uniref:Uncharacterized protein n=1 Tax=Ohtaekwangia kribbensis TaxID=688913 RepID=A0ABW3KA13_9BACT